MRKFLAALVLAIAVPFVGAAQAETYCWNTDTARLCVSVDELVPRRPTPTPTVQRMVPLETPVSAPPAAPTAVPEPLSSWRPSVFPLSARAGVAPDEPLDIDLAFRLAAAIASGTEALGPRFEAADELLWRYSDEQINAYLWQRYPTLGPRARGRYAIAGPRGHRVQRGY